MFFEQLYNNTSLLIWILVGILTASLAVQLYYYLYLFTRIARWKPQKASGKYPAVTVVICARNEAENLALNLPHILVQDYPEFEVVVVNDCSTDNSEDILMDLKVKHPNLRYTTINPDKKFTHGKKLALTVGIKSAAFEHLLLTDADCHPVSDQWIRKMSRNFSKEKELILGVGKYEQRRGVLNILVRFETLFTAMNYISAALRKRPYMGVGRNMAYRKELFFRNKGFASHLKVISGDDDLFVKEVANKENTAIEIDPDSFTVSEAPRNFAGWFKQKKRHLSTAKYYKPSSKLRLGVEYGSRFIFYVSLISLFFIPDWNYIAAASLALLWIVKIVVIKLNMNLLKEKYLLVPSLVLDILLPILLGAITISNILRPRGPKWN